MFFTWVGLELEASREKLMRGLTDLLPSRPFCSEPFLPLASSSDPRKSFIHATHPTLEMFLECCQEYFAWSGPVIAQPYEHRLAEGMIVCGCSANPNCEFVRRQPSSPEFTLSERRILLRPANSGRRSKGRHEID